MLSHLCEHCIRSYLFLFQNDFLLQNLHSIVLFVFLVPREQNLWISMLLAFSVYKYDMCLHVDCMKAVCTHLSKAPLPDDL